MNTKADPNWIMCPECGQTFIHEGALVPNHISINSLPYVLYRIARALRCDMGYFYAPIRTAETVTF